MSLGDFVDVKAQVLTFSTVFIDKIDVLINSTFINENLHNKHVVLIQVKPKIYSAETIPRYKEMFIVPYP